MSNFNLISKTLHNIQIIMKSQLTKDDLLLLHKVFKHGLESTEKVMQRAGLTGEENGNELKG